MDQQELEKAARERVAWEATRESQCRCRSRGSCLDISLRLGWSDATSPEICDRCFGLGGEKGTIAVDYREGYVLKVIENFRSPEIVKTLPRDIYVPLSIRHLSLDEVRSLEQDPEVQFSINKTQRWNSVKSTWSKALSFAASLKSRLLEGRVDPRQRNRRNIACFGTSTDGARVSQPCPSLQKSADGKHHFCGACGCGDTVLARLDADESDGHAYTKLDYPHLVCPRGNF